MDNKKRLVWMVTPDCPRWVYSAMSGLKDETTFIEFLADARELGWVEIFGVTDKDPKDILAQLQEFYDVKYIKGDE